MVMIYDGHQSVLSFNTCECIYNVIGNKRNIHVT